MRRRRFVVSAALAAIALALPGCGLAEEDRTPDYRYRLTVEVDTPEGLRTGSSVIEVEQNMGRSAGTGFGKIIMRRIRGEAVAVDLPGGHTLFALLQSEDETDWASTVMHYLAPKVEGEKFEEKFDNVLLVKGERELPRYWPPLVNGDVFAAYPMLVRFADIADPKTVEKVDPDNLAAVFGKGTKLRRITVQLTDDPVISGIERRLGWLAQAGKLGLKVEDHPDLPLGNFRGLFSTEFE